MLCGTDSTGMLLVRWRSRTGITWLRQCVIPFLTSSKRMHPTIPIHTMLCLEDSQQAVMHLGKFLSASKVAKFQKFLCTYIVWRQSIAHVCLSEARHVWKVGTCTYTLIFRTPILCTWRFVGPLLRTYAEITVDISLSSVSISRPLPEYVVVYS